MTPTLFIGIDPGMSGSIAFVCSSGDHGAYKMPETLRDILDLLMEIANNPDHPACFAILEEVGAMPKQGLSSTFKFGRGYGALEMGLIATSIPFERARPQVWQKFMGCLTHGDKNVSKRRATELFPKMKITHTNADGILIAEYARRTYKP